MTTVGIQEAQTNLSELAERALAGEEVVITRDGVPVVRLTPFRPGNQLERLRGIWRGKVRIAEDFDVLPDDVSFT